MENKKLYESVIIIKGTLSEDKYKIALERIVEEIKKYIDIYKIDEVGLKNLAYEIQKNKKGYFVVIYYKAVSQAIINIERIFRIKDDILKFITVRKDD